MENRIDRKNDESLYQPKIHSERIKALYGLKQATGKPMTVLLDQAIRDLAANYGIIYQFEEEPAWACPDLVDTENVAKEYTKSGAERWQRETIGSIAKPSSWKP
jgi:hypothetical protein